MVIFRQISSLQYMEKLEFDSRYREGVDIIYGLEHHIFIFPGKPKNHMGDDGDVPLMQLFYSMGKAAGRIAPPDIPGSLFVYCLQTQFYPDEFAGVIFL